MYDGMAALAWIELTQQGKKIPMRIEDIATPIYTTPGSTGAQISLKSGGAPINVDETPAAVYTAINGKWTDWLNAFPA